MSSDLQCSAAVVFISYLPRHFDLTTQYQARIVVESQALEIPPAFELPCSLQELNSAADEDGERSVIVNGIAVTHGHYQERLVVSMRASQREHQQSVCPPSYDAAATAL